MKEITENGKVLAKYIPKQWKDGLAFYSNDAEFIQVGTWCYNKGKELLAHRHNTVERTITKTQEVIHIVSGRVRARIYNEKDKLIKKLDLTEGDTLILLNGGHGYDILEDETRVLEVKNGPYPGPEADRTRL